MKNLDRLLTAPWPMHPRSLARLALRLQEDAPDETAEPEPPEVESRGPVAVLPFEGITIQHPGLFDAWPAVYTEWWGEAFDSLLADDEVRGIVVPIDSPGGISYGVAELSEKIFAARGLKPVVAVANSMAASAAYWVGTAFEQLLVTPGGDVGSVGVWTMHVDMSKALEEMGLDVTLISAGEFKVEGNPFEPLDEEAEAELQRGVDEVYGQFVEGVARNRDVTTDTVLADFGQGRMLSADRAVRAGMADGVATLEQVIRDMEVRVGGSAGNSERGAPVLAARSAQPDLTEVRNVDAVECRAESEGRKLVGTALNFQSLSKDLGGFREQFTAGPANLSDPELRVIWQHDRSCVFGRVGAGTARFDTDERGLQYQADPPNAQWAKDAMESVRRGDVHQSSFCFRVHAGGDRFERRDGEVVRTVENWDLIEAGPQTLPAYADTTTATRGLRAFLKREARVRSERMRELARTR